MGLGCAAPPPVLLCPSELGFSPSHTQTCPARRYQACCLDPQAGVSEEEAFCIADALGFWEGPGGRSAELDPSLGLWRLTSVGESPCGPPGSLADLEGCALDLDAQTGSFFSEAWAFWTVQCFSSRPRVSHDPRFHG